MGNDTETPPPALERMNEPSSSADSPAASDGKPARNSYQYYERRASWQGRRPSGRVSQRRSSIVPYDPSHGPRRWWRIVLREWEDGEEESWWFASTAIPLLAATIGPLANVLSIAALVTYWRMCNISGATPDDAAQCLGDTSNLVAPLAGQTYQDPHWCIALNAVSLAMGWFWIEHIGILDIALTILQYGFVGNFFLLCNFTNRIRYIIALPVTIVMWYIATAILIALTISMELYVPPIRPQQSYTQGYVYAIIAACMYMIAAMLLMVNMLGFFLGHYPQHFALTESQRTLILQTMLFFIWLAGGAAVFSKVESSYGRGVQDWSYVNSLYFCDVTILTVGFGDLYPTSDAGRGLVFPFSVGGIIMLGLMVSSISKFAGELGSEKIIRRHVERSRTRTFGRTVTSSLELEHRQTLQDGERPIISAPFPMELQEDRQKTIKIADDPDQLKKNRRTGTGLQSLRRVMTMTSQVRIRKTKLILLREEKDHFDAMRHIQHDTTRFKHWYALLMSMIAFGVLWCAGAMVFWLCERDVQGMTYFQALYFCYVSLLTIGYGDLAPQSNAGRPFFVLWSLIAVPTMTILVSDLGETVINKFKHGTNGLADFTILPKEGVWHGVVDRIPAIATMLQWLQRKTQEHEAKKRLEEGFPAGPDPEEPAAMTLDELATDEPTRDELARRLPIAIRKTADDMKDDARKRYSYEEWVEFTKLIRFSAKKEEDKETDDEEDEGLVDWDWIGEDSPMMSKDSEAKFVLDRLCESLNRYLKQVIASNSIPLERARQIPPARGLDDIEEVLARVPTAEDDEFMIDDVGPRNETAVAHIQGLGAKHSLRI
ncbi:Potassium channel [Friedmanniomyces endolithicus]|uniref:Potassium channel n=1 Tax=Rachicladosporium monterosium TaxID=1507873 RepID=A0ABR0KZ33_9PEZI|nr:Potassium channel [Friedmanniomyces endolithicus]KAK1082739.1 Potassium channel [Friedmanniomyces endolithicus]KAK5140412.1 Potassium channel [Rachicladosporium monterosium]